MDSKEVKSLLKQAREAIRNKDYKAALKHCKAVLKNDKNNYNAWVFVGAAAQEMDELDQACSAFERAVQVAPDQLLAWQGYANFYERYGKEKNYPKLAEIYEKMLDLLQSDRSKQLSILAKLIPLYRSLGNVQQCIKIMKKYFDLFEGTTAVEHESLKEFVNFLGSQPKIAPDYAEMLENAYKQLLHAEGLDTSPENEDLYGSYLLYLTKKGNTDQVMEESKRFLALYPNSKTPLEIICKMILAKYIDDLEVKEAEFNIAHTLLQTDPSSGVARMALGIQLLNKKDYGAAIKEISDGIVKYSDVPEGWLILALTYLHLHHYTEVEESSLKGIKLLSTAGMLSCKSVVGKLYLCYCKALIENGKYSVAAEALNKCEVEFGRTNLVLELHFNLQLKQGNLKLAEQVCAEFKEVLCADHPQALLIEGELLLNSGQHAESQEKLKQSLLKNQSAWGYHLLGLSYWSVQAFQQSYELFFRAAKLDPYYHKNFVYLGHCYRKKMNDLSNALKCYRRAFQLNGNDEECGAAISDVLHEIGEEDTNMKFLSEIIERNPINPPKWASVRFGLNRLMQADPSSAIYAFQKALRSDWNDSNCWEYLGEAYHLQGSYESALKAFQRASELKPNELYPLYQIANMKQLSGLYKEAIEEYRNILNIHRNYIPALKGLAESLFAQASAYMLQALFGLGFDCLEEALKSLTRIVMIRPELSCIWKLLGDVCCVPGLLGPKEFSLSFPSALIPGSQCSNYEKCQTVDVIRNATRFYKQAISLQPEVAGFWHDLGVAFYILATRASEENTQKEESQKAVFAVKKALSLDPSNHRLWNSLGVLAMLPSITDYAVAQHCFIKAIQIEKNNANAWTNLGLLYLLNDNIKLANEAFSVAQSLDPLHPTCWVGQALIAERVSHSDTMDLFRHTTQLGNHPESLLGYAHWVCSMLLDKDARDTELFRYNIEKMHAVASASDALVKYTVTIQTNAPAYTMLGMILERQGLQKGALEAYKRALNLLEGNQQHNEKALEKCRISYARILRRSGDVQKAFSEYQKLKNYDTALFCELALCLQKIGRDQQAFQAYSKALNSTTDEATKSHIQVAMAFLSRKLNGPDSAKRLLFESSQLVPASVPGLQALCALGILEGDKALTTAAVKALAPHVKSANYRPGIVLLTTCLYLMKWDLKQARNQICQSVHQYPGDATLWQQLAVHFLQLQPNGAKYAVQFAHTANLHQGEFVHLSYILSLSYLLTGSKKAAFRTAQKSIHFRPDFIQSWSSLLANVDSISDNEIIKRLFKFVHENGALMSSDNKLLRRFNVWLYLVESHTYLQRKDFSLARSVIQKAVKDVSDEQSAPKFAFLASLCEMLTECTTTGMPRDDYVKKTALVLKQDSSLSFAWMVLHKVFLSLGRISDADKMLKQWLMLPTSKESKSRLLPLIVQLVSLLCKFEHNAGGEEALMPQIKETVKEALKIDPENKAVAFCNGVFGYKIKNKGLMRKNFHEVLKKERHQESTWMDKVARRVLLYLSTSNQDSSPPDILLQSALDAKDEEFIKLYRSIYPECKNKSDEIE